MKHRRVALVLACLLIRLCGSGLDAAPANPVADEAKQDRKAEKPAKPVIHKGMTAAEILRLIGKPEQVKPIVVGDVKGESWIYRRVAKRTMNQTAATMETVPTFGGLGIQGDGIVDIQVPSQRLENITIYQMTALLIFDGKLVATKQWFEQERHFE